MYLQTHSWFSLRYGCLSPMQLLEQARLAGVDCVALTDINSTSAVLDFVRLAPKFGVRPVVGVDCRNGVASAYVCLARDNGGYQALCSWLSAQLHAGNRFTSRGPHLPGVVVVYPLRKWDGHRLQSHERLGVSLADLNHLRVHARRYPLEQAVILQPATFSNDRHWHMHRLLRAIDNNCLLSKLPETELAQPGDVWMPLEKLLAAFADFPELVYHTRCLLDDCRIQFEFGEQYPHKNLRTYTGNEGLDYRLMRHLCYAGLPYRYPQPSAQVLERLAKELEIIRQKRYVSYFLINWKMLKYARSKGYFYVGRGSGANSLVAYLLRITDVDPVELDLYFERFINLYRRNPPDFDIDFSWADRDDVIRFMFSRFPHVALLGTYITFQFKAVVRELGKVFGLPKDEIDRLSEGKFDVQQLDRQSRLLLQYAGLLQDIPSHLSIHAGGILITETPIAAFTATFMPPKGFPTTMFDMVVAEDAGLYKFDVLSQRGLGKIRDTLDVIAYNRPDAPAFDIHDIKRFKEDERIKELLRHARAIGCFYVESPAMRMLMRKLRVDDYLGLVAASSVIRPGVSNSGMMREYILRYRFPERRKEAHPVMLKIMPETYGVMVYQEDVIKVAHYFAGLSLAEADVLRRGMSGKFRGREEFEQVRQKFFANCRQRAYADALSSEVWRQIESFAGYAFAKGHSASYAVESYQSLFLKAYFPIEYMVATLNNAGGFYSAEHYVHEARMQGAHIEGPCVNQSELLVRAAGSTIWLALTMIKGLESKAAAAIVHQRRLQGPFVSLTDCCRRSGIAHEQAALLVRAGAFRFTGKTKKQLMWEVHLGVAPKPQNPMPELFRSAVTAYQLPALDQEQLEDAFDELELLGFPLCSPFDLLLEAPPRGISAADLPAHKGREVCISGYLVTLKDTRTSKGERMQFGTFIDRAGDYLDTVHFPQVAQQYPFRGRGIYAIYGRVTEEFDCYVVEVSRLDKLALVPDPRYADGKVKRQAG
ncbi:MAG: DNA polymerase III subunit alpha [Bacteroidia bacterium]